MWQIESTTPEELVSDHIETDHVWTTGVHKYCRLAAVDCLCQGAIKKHVLHIQLIHGPRARSVTEQSREPCTLLQASRLE